MILLSLSRNKGYISWVVYGDGFVQARGTQATRPVTGFESFKEVGIALEQGLKALNTYLEGKVGTLPDNETIKIESSHRKVYDWLVEMNIADKYVHFVKPCMAEFQKLPLPVTVEYKKIAVTLMANKYNSAEFVTDTSVKVFKATDIF